MRFICLAVRTEASKHLCTSATANVETRHKGISKFTTYRAPYRQPPTVRRRRRREWAGAQAAPAHRRGPAPLPPPRAAATPAAPYSRTRSLARLSARASTSSSTIRGSRPGCPCPCTAHPTRTLLRPPPLVWPHTSLPLLLINRRFIPMLLVWYTFILIFKSESLYLSQDAYDNHTYVRTYPSI